MRILLVEDDEQLNETLSFQLESEGFTVDSCFDGEEACYYGEQNIYDVILLDRMLPQMEGTEILTLLRKKGITTPVIFLTALGSPQLTLPLWTEESRKISVCMSPRKRR